MRPGPLLKLLGSVALQTAPPDEVIIVDGSPDSRTEEMLAKASFADLHYFLVPPAQRGLTKQRNFGISKTSEDTEVICFLDDDTVLEGDYFEQLLDAYRLFPDAAGVGGYITNEVAWQKIPDTYAPKSADFVFDGWKRSDGSRFIIRKKLGLDTDRLPGFSPDFSHGRSIGFLPPSGKIYKVEQLMGGVSSFRKSVFKDFSFSEYFEGYGLYEDADFTLRLSKKAALYVTTRARLSHFHEGSGRPNQYRYGKMVVRNGWYVWRVKSPKPSLKARFKWHAITLLLTAIRFTNIFTTVRRKEAFSETMGRIAGYVGLAFSKPLATAKKDAAGI
jgi:glycosyltransferase involved in cell wall biosynthesis